MPHHPGERHPHVAVGELGIGGAGRGIVVNAGPFDLRTVALRERVVEREDDPLGNRHDPADQPQQRRGEVAALASDARQSVIVALEVVPHTGRRNPAADRPPALGEQRARQQRLKPRPDPRVQNGRETEHPFEHLRRQNPRSHPWLSRTVRVGDTHVLPGEPSFVKPHASNAGNPRYPVLGKCRRQATREKCLTVPRREGRHPARCQGILERSRNEHRSALVPSHEPIK